MATKIYRLLQKLKHRKAAWFCLGLLGFALLILLLPKPDLYNRYSFSGAVYDRSGSLLKLSLSLDDKYRLFTPLQDIPNEAKQALLLYEDRGFYRHFGVSPSGLARAVLSLGSGKRRQGGSTVTMQLARIVYQINSASFLGKAEQILRALQIELFYSKEQILEAYFNVAPYGGNIEGIGAASLIYFKQPVNQLNLPQILALTVIPQNPAKRNLLTAQNRKSNRLAAGRLKNIWRQKYRHPQNDYLDLPLDSSVYLPDFAPHFTRRIFSRSPKGQKTALYLPLQTQITEILQKYTAEHSGQGVYNAAALLADSRDMSVLAYAGSADFYNAAILGQVDGITARRSPGSALKPFIYALALQNGLIHPLSMLKDVPSRYGFYEPENFDRSYYGILDATQALALSRNIPAVTLLEQIGEQNFYNLLKNCGVKLSKPADYYGLAMALGGVEVSMVNLAAMYAMLANNGRFSPLRFTTEDTLPAKQLIAPEAAFLTRYMLNREFAGNPRIPYASRRHSFTAAWKTGTSYSYKDAWTAGIFGDYVLVVWLGNFDGTPNPAFVGKDLAAPLFFRIAEQISSRQNSPLLPPPNLNLAKVKICRSTGDLATDFCPKTAETYFIPQVTHIKNSGIARLIPIDKASGLRACRHTPPATELKSYNFWPSDVQNAFRKAGISFKRPPAFLKDCDKVEDFKQGQPPKIIFPINNSKIIINQRQKTIALQAASDADADKIYWFINDGLAGQSRVGEVLEAVPPFGTVKIKAVDNLGRQNEITVSILPAAEQPR